jgi:hypothetical protein
MVSLLLAPLVVSVSCGHGPDLTAISPEAQSKVASLKSAGEAHLGRFYQAVEKRDGGHVTLDAPIPWYSVKDPDGAPTALEFAAQESGKDAGYVVVSLGPDEPKVVRFDTGGPRLLAQIKAVAERKHVTIDKLILMNGIAMARTTRQQLVVESGALLDAKTTLQKLTEVPPEADQSPEIDSTSSAITLKSSNLAYDCPIEGSTPLYKQFDAPRVVDQPVGCGPTAWGIVLGWISQRAFDGDPVWGPLKGVMREGGEAQGNLNPQRAASSQGPAEERMMVHIMESLGSLGTGSGTPTTPAMMADVMNYLGNVGLHSSVRVDSFHYGGGHFSSIWTTVERNLCVWKTPTVIGVGQLEHYAVAERIYKDAVTGHRYIWLNSGWGWSGDFDDFPYYGLYLAATVFPRHAEMPVGSLVAFGKCADVRGGVSQPNGTPVQLYDCHGGANQLWKIGASGQVASKGGRCLQEGAPTSQYAHDIHIQDCNATDPTQSFTPTDIKLFTKDRLCLDGDPVKGVRAASCTNATSQQFTYQPGGSLRTADGLCLSAADPASPGSPISAVACDQGRQQRFWFGGDGAIRAYNENCLTFTQQGVTVDACTNSDQQQIAFRGQVKSQSGYCLDVQQSSTNNQTPLQLHNCNSTDAQMWTYTFRP